MSDRLSIIAKSYATQPESFLRVQKVPVLLWENAPTATKLTPELIWNTQGNYKPGSAAVRDPLVFKLVKRERRINAFPLGVTVGRTSNNDIQFDDPSVSRFHAYFQKDEHSGIWHVVDAESFNGTLCNGERLQPNRPAPMAAKVDLEFGSVAIQFLSAAAFEDLLKARAGGT